MRIVLIEPTPSPNTMKIALDETLPKGVQRTYTSSRPQQPEWVNRILAVGGIRSVFHTADFLAIDRLPQGNWQTILAEVRDIIGSSESGSSTADVPAPAEGWGEVKVFVQTFRSIPLQIRIQSGTELIKLGLPDRFSEAGMRAGMASPTLLKERTLQDWGIRYGELNEVGEEIIRELDAAYPNDRLERLVARSSEQGDGPPAPEERSPLAPGEVRRLLASDDWKTRYAALQRLPLDSDEALGLLKTALADPEMSIRRLAVVFLGDLRKPESLPLLFQALKDKSVAVRRTAGDTLNDIGDPAAIGPMAEALADPNKLVRWRAARFLYEYGDETALDALRKAESDPEFEVSLQARMALVRIESGEEAEGSVWQQMTRRSES